MDGNQIILARDQDFLSLRSGGAEIYWTPPQSYGSVIGARGLRLFLTVVSITANSKLRIIGQWSVDGKNWTDFSTAINGLDNTGSADITAATTLAIDYAADFKEFTPYVRFGISIENTGSVQSQARVTAAIEPLFDDSIYVSALVAASGTALPVSVGTPVSIGNAIATEAFKYAMVYATVTTPAGVTPTNLDQVILSIQGNDGGDPSNDGNWFELGTITGFSAATAGSTARLESKCKLIDPVVRNLRVRGTTSATVSGSPTVLVRAILRQI